MFKRDYLKKPAWLKTGIPSGNEYKEVAKLLKDYQLATVCQEARCPNIAECWSKKSATIMIMGRVCTRSCRFCAVLTGNPRGMLDHQEPLRVAGLVKKLGLKYVVITSVDRDDLKDFGSSHYSRTILAVKKANPHTKIEVLIPDFSAAPTYLKKVVDAKPNVIGHNIETVERLTPSIRDSRCSYNRSLKVLKEIKNLAPDIYTKSGFLLGLGETDKEVVNALKDLKEAEVDIVTIGQYLQPTRRHLVVQKYYHPEEFRNYKKVGESLGIKYVLSAPLIRSSYRASEVL